MCARSVIPLPGLGLLAAWGFQQDLLQLRIAHIPSSTVWPSPFPIVVEVRPRFCEPKREDKNAEKCQETARQSNCAESSEGVVRVPRSWRRRPDGGDKRSALVRHLLGIGDHTSTVWYLFVTCQPHLGGVMLYSGLLSVVMSSCNTHLGLLHNRFWCAEGNRKLAG